MRDLRLRLEELKAQLKKSKKKSRSPKKRGGLKSASNFDAVTADDGVSAYTGYTSEMDKLIDPKDKITVDYFPLQSKPRSFRARTSILSLLGIPKYDECKNIEQLDPQVSNAIELFKRRRGTVDVDKIKRIMRLGMVREIAMIESRKHARSYNEIKPIQVEDEEQLSAEFSGQSSPSFLKPKKTQ